jgi:torulene dioxygenase
VDNFIENIRKTGSMDGFSFGQKRDPCQGYFNKLQSLFVPPKPLVPDDGKSSSNIAVTLTMNMPGLDSKASKEHASSSAKTLVLKTDASIMSEIDSETLEPVGIARQVSLHPDLKGPLSGAHARSDATGDIFNFNLDLGRQPTYRVFKVSASTGKTTILATFPGAPAYIHSLFLTADHVILCVWNSHLAGRGIKMLWTRNIIDAIKDYDPSCPTKWYVIDRHGGGLVATYESPTFYAFHTINAWTEPSKTKEGTVDIVAEVAAYESLDIIKKVYYDNLMSNGKDVQKYQASLIPDSARSRLRRYRLPQVPTTPTNSILKAELEWTAPDGMGIELPTINPLFLTLPHRYSYGIIDRAKSSFYDGLVKFDSVSKTAKHWETFGHTPGEPILIPNPDGKGEDDGVLLSVVLDGYSGQSYLLCLDATTMQELGRADVGGVVGFGFHGAFSNAHGVPQPTI